MQRKDAGLSLIELLLGLVILSIILGLAVPAFGRLLHETRLTATTNQLVAAIHLTRAEAVRRNARVTLCKSADGQHCTDNGGWEQGWLVFVDTLQTGTPDQPDAILHSGRPTSPDITLHGNAPVRDYVSYVGLGATRRLSGGLQMGTLNVCGPETMGRQIILGRTGRPRVQSGGCEA